MGLDELARKLGFPKLIFFPIPEKGGFTMEDLKKIKEMAMETEGELKTLLASLQEVEDELIEALEKHHLTDLDTLELFNHKGISIQRFRSNVGGYIALCYKGGQIPPSIGWFGRSFYVHNDFNCPAHYLSVPEALELSEKLPEYLEFFKAKLQELKSRAGEMKEAVEGLVLDLLQES